MFVNEHGRKGFCYSQSDGLFVDSVSLRESAGLDVIPFVCIRLRSGCCSCVLLLPTGPTTGVSCWLSISLLCRAETQAQNLTRSASVAPSPTKANTVNYCPYWLLQCAAVLSCYLLHPSKRPVIHLLHVAQECSRMKKCRKILRTEKCFFYVVHISAASSCQVDEWNWFWQCGPGLHRVRRQPSWQTFLPIAHWCPPLQWRLEDGACRQLAPAAATTSPCPPRWSIGATTSKYLLPFLLLHWLLLPPSTAALLHPWHYIESRVLRGSGAEEPAAVVQSGDTITVETATQHAGDDYDKMVRGDPAMEDIYTWTQNQINVPFRGRTGAPECHVWWSLTPWMCLANSL